MLTSLLSRIDALVPDRRCLRAVEGMHTKPGLEEDETHIVLQMPKSDLYYVYQLNLDPKTWDYTIRCNDGMVRINRFFACVLFEPIQTKVMQEGWTNTPEEYYMKEVNEEELRALLLITFAKGPVSLRKRDLVRCAEIAAVTLFWEPARLFLQQSIEKELSIEIRAIEKEVTDQEMTLTLPYIMNVQPNMKELPKRYSYGKKAVEWVIRGEFYVCLDNWGDPQIVLCADTIYHANPKKMVNVLDYPRRQYPRAFPMKELHPLKSFDQVKAQVGYPAIDHIQEGESPNPVTVDTIPQLVGKFYTFHNSYTTGRTNAVMDRDLKIVFLLDFSDNGRNAYIAYPLEEGVKLVDPHDLRTITMGEGATDEAACSRANLIMNADPPPSTDVFGSTPCTNIAELRAGAYYECPYNALRKPMGTIDTQWVHRTPVLYLGPAPEGKAYVFSRDREAIVDVKYLYPQTEDLYPQTEEEMSPRGRSRRTRPAPRTHT
jgi:hypothetical protein